MLFVEISDTSGCIEMTALVCSCSSSSVLWWYILSKLYKTCNRRTARQSNNSIIFPWAMLICKWGVLRLNIRTPITKNKVVATSVYWLLNITLIFTDYRRYWQCTCKPTLTVPSQSTWKLAIISNCTMVKLLRLNWNIWTIFRHHLLCLHLNW